MKAKEEITPFQEEQLKKIGEKLKTLRISKGHTSYEYFAFENNINRAQYGRYERGQNMNILTLIRILEIHEITLEEFFNQ